MTEQKCRKCGEMVEAEDMDKPADFYYCDCGRQWMDEQGWYERQCDMAERRLGEH